MFKSPSVSFIGAGNLAWHLAPVLDNTGFAVREVYSRKQRHAADLVEKLYEAEIKTDLDFSESSSSVFIIAVPDDAIEDVVERLIVPKNSLVIHTSGSQPLEILDGLSTSHTGVFYLLQTFTKGKKVEFQDIPIFIESENEDTQKALMNMGKSIAKKVYKISSRTRKAIHVSAVFASNFTNHMLSIAQQIMKDNKLDYDLLKPLIAETISKSLSIGPIKAQTGPARRGDLEVLDSHMEFLKKDKATEEMYRVISQHILDMYHDGS